MRSVNIAGTGSFLPGAPVSNEQVDQVLGPLERAPECVRKFCESLGPRMLNRGGIKERHFAVDPATGDLTHTFSSLAEVAARDALAMAGWGANDIDLLIISCPSYDQSTPPTSAVLQERLGIEKCAELEIHSNCAGVGKAVQVAYDAIRCGRFRRALVCYSQISSVYLRSCYFHQEKMNKVNAALRWILADGAGALALEASEDNGHAHRMLGTSVESVGGGKPAGMTAGGAVADLVHASAQIPELYNAGRHHLWQDFTAVNGKAAPLLLEGLENFTKKLEIDSSKVDHYVVSIPTRQLYDDYVPTFLERLRITEDQIKFRCGDTGYCGGAATLIHLDRMVRSRELRTGDVVVVYAVESSKWMTAGFAVQW